MIVLKLIYVSKRGPWYQIYVYDMGILKVTTHWRLQARFFIGLTPSKVHINKWLTRLTSMFSKNFMYLNAGQETLPNGLVSGQFLYDHIYFKHLSV